MISITRTIVVGDMAESVTITASPSDLTDNLFVDMAKWIRAALEIEAEAGEADVETGDSD